MKDSMLSLDIRAWVEENRGFIEGGFFKKIYQVGEREFLFKIYHGETRPLYVNLRGWIYFESKETPMEPSVFVMFLRKRFSGKRIERFYQLNFDRIIVFEISDYKLILELFGEGNIIVVRDGIIERAFMEREWRHRSVLRGEEYIPPPQALDPIIHGDSLCIEMEKGGLDLVRTLARRYNLGKYAEEVCVRAGVDKNSKELSEEECERARNAMLSMFKFTGGYVYDGFFSPVEMKMLGEPLERYESFNDALKSYLKGEQSAENPEILRIKRRIEEIEESIERFAREEEESRKKGDAIYAHFQEVQDAIERARRGEIQYDKARKVLKMNLEGMEIEISIEKSVGENAGIYYDKSKRMREKIKGAEEALRRAKEEMKEVKKKEERKKREVRKNRRRFWFEKYRWFISSEGKIVIAGRDAKTNEEVVKKHLGAKDLYMHADIHGAPSVVIKSDGDEIGEKTLEEAAQFAVSMSKAWNAGFGNLSAYWVYPSQVSKMGESGEYVAKGAWVVHGKRNYIHKVPLELAVGEIEYMGTKMVMCGPVSAVASRSEKYIRIKPGSRKKEEIAKIVARAFGISTDEALRLLPPGKADVVEAKGVSVKIR